MKEHGMPKFAHLRRAYPNREAISDNHFIITEICTHPDGGYSIERHNTFKTQDGWKVGGVEEEDISPGDSGKNG